MDDISPEFHKTVTSGKFLYTLGFVLIICAALSIQIWSATQGSANFDSDEAIHGLMALHILNGQYPVYYYGQNYLGALEAYVAAFFMNLFEPGVFTLRIPSLIFICIFFIVQGLLVYRLWGGRIALLSLLILAFPSWRMLPWTFRPATGFAPLLPVGTLILLLTFTRTGQRELKQFRNIIIGALIGFAVWLHPMASYYLLILGFVYWLFTPEWSNLHGRISDLNCPVLNIKLRKLLPLITSFLLFLGVLALFTGGCEPKDLFAILRLSSSAILASVILFLIAVPFLLSRRKRVLISGGIYLFVGFIVGNLPQWGSWVFRGIHAGTLAIESCPTGIWFRIKLVFLQLFPTMWGTPPFVDIFEKVPHQLALWHRSPVQILLGLAVILFVILSLRRFFWGENNFFTALFSLKVQRKQGHKWMLIGLMFVLPLFLSLFSSNTRDIHSTRYLILSWQAGSVILALYFARVFDFSKVFGILLIAVWIGFIGLGNLVEIGKYWNEEKDQYSTESLVALEDYLGEHSVQGGYADYWIAHVLNFLTRERLTFSAYNGVLRIPEYPKVVANLSKYVFIFNRDDIEPDTDQLEAMKAHMRRNIGAGAASQRFINHLDGLSLVERRQVASWDVWLLSNPMRN